MSDEEPTLYKLPFRGGTLEVWSDTSPGKLAIIAQLSLADPRLDAFYMAAGVTLEDPNGRVVFPPPKRGVESGVHVVEQPWKELPPEEYKRLGGVNGSQPKDRSEEEVEAHPGVGEGDRQPKVAAVEPEGRSSGVADAEGASPSEEGGVFDLFG